MVSEFSLIVAYIIHCCVCLNASNLVLITIDLILTIYYWKLSNNFIIFNSLIKIQFYSKEVTFKHISFLTLKVNGAGLEKCVIS
jgi:hypothetical protein